MKKISSAFVILGALLAESAGSLSPLAIETPNLELRIVLRTIRFDPSGLAMDDFFYLSDFTWNCSRIFRIRDPTDRILQRRVVEVNDSLAPCAMLRSAQDIRFKLSQSDLNCDDASVPLPTAKGENERLQLDRKCQCTIFQESNNPLGASTVTAVPFYYCLPLFSDRAANVSMIIYGKGR